MAESFRTFVVVNPHSANGSTRRLWHKIAREIEKAVGDFEHAFTDGPLHATALARKALESGAEMVVSVGGDGTHNEIVNGFFKENGTPVNEDAVFAVISRGTGADLIKTLRLPKDYEQAAAVLRGKNARTLDVGKIALTPHAGVPATRYFINIADFGLGGVTVDKVNNTTKIFGGKISFYIGILRALLSYKPVPMEIVLDDGVEKIERVFSQVNVANGRFFGGGIQIAPKAEMDDGFFDVVFMEPMSLWENLSLSGAVYRGELEQRSTKIYSRRARKVEARASQTVLLDVDGEQPGSLPATFEIVPRAIRVKVP